MEHFLDDQYSCETAALSEVRVLTEILRRDGEFDLSGVEQALEEMQITDERDHFATALQWICSELEEGFGAVSWTRDVQAIVQSLDCK